MLPQKNSPEQTWGGAVSGASLVASLPSVKSSEFDPCHQRNQRLEGRGGEESEV